MPRIEIDFLAAERPRRWPTLLLLVIAIAFAGDLVRTNQLLGAELAAAQRRLAGPSRAAAPGNAQIESVNARPEDFDSARVIVQRLSIPWGSLFQALEAAQTERVALLAIEPDASSGIVNLSGEGRDYLAVLSYVATLEQQKELKRVHLARHEWKQTGRDRTVSFTVNASWKVRE